MTKLMTIYEGAPSKLVNPMVKMKRAKSKVRTIGVAQLVDALRLVERQLPIVLNTNIDKEEKEYILYLADRALKGITGDRRNEIGV